MNITTLLERERELVQEIVLHVDEDSVEKKLLDLEATQKEVLKEVVLFKLNTDIETKKIFT